MPTAKLEGHTFSINEEGFLTVPEEWKEELAPLLAAQIGITLTDQHWEVIHFLRVDYADTGETPTLRRVSTRTDIPVKALFALFPQKPAKKMAYIAGLPKPHGCV